jgi:hypothetical protein
MARGGLVNDLTQADALLDAVRLTVAGNTAGAGMLAIPAINHAPIVAGSLLIQFVADAVRAYALAADIHPATDAVDRLWSKPAGERA